MIQWKTNYEFLPRALSLHPMLFTQRLVRLRLLSASVKVPSQTLLLTVGWNVQALPVGEMA